MKVNQHTQCYKCQRYGYFANQCLSQTKTLLVEVFINEDEEKEDGLELIVYQQDDDSDICTKDREFSGCIRTLASTDHSYNRAHLAVVRCTLAQPDKSIVGEEL